MVWHTGQQVGAREERAGGSINQWRVCAEKLHLRVIYGPARRRGGEVTGDKRRTHAQTHLCKPNLSHLEEEGGVGGWGDGGRRREKGMGGGGEEGGGGREQGTESCLCVLLDEVISSLLMCDPLLACMCWLLLLLLQKRECV